MLAIIDVGLGCGGVGCLARGMDIVAASLGLGEGDALSLPADCGRSPEKFRFPNDACRWPTAGVFGASGSLCRFSNLDRSEETGRIDVSSGPLP